jgi:Predicted Rossmann fold nucleotide-binding protein involved in DNA uptake
VRRDRRRRGARTQRRADHGGLALEEGREVFAVPGEITSSLSAGTNGLLKLGAAL